MANNTFVTKTDESRHVKSVQRQLESAVGNSVPIFTIRTDGIAVPYRITQPLEVRIWGLASKFPQLDNPDEYYSLGKPLPFNKSKSGWARDRALDRVIDPWDGILTPCTETQRNCELALPRIRQITGRTCCLFYGSLEPPANESHFVTVKTSENHLVILHPKGVYTIGDNTFGQIGIGDSYGFVVTPFQLIGADEIKSIAAANQLTIMLAYDGDIYICGGNTYFGINESIFMPKKACNFKIDDQHVSFTAIDANGSTFIGIDSMNNIWQWGSSLNSNILPNPQRTGKIPDGINILEIYLGHRIIISLDSNGDIWFYSNKTMAITPLLIDGEDKCQLSPQDIQLKRIRSIKKFKQISLKGSHALCLTTDNEVWTFGRNECGQLGREGKELFGPVELPQGIVHSVYAGTRHSCVLFADCSLYVWGHSICKILLDGVNGHFINYGNKSSALVQEPVLGVSLDCGYRQTVRYPELAFNCLFEKVYGVAAGDDTTITISSLADQV